MALLAVLLPVYGHAAETEKAALTLSCDGTQLVKGRNGERDQTWPITDRGVYVNLSERTITGLFIDGRIRDISEARVNFELRDDKDYHLSGSIDRITGKLFAEYVLFGTQHHIFTLSCKPTKRLF